jgi:hypothetical protein
MNILLCLLLAGSLFAQTGDITVRTQTKREPFLYMKETYTEIAVLTKNSPVSIEVTGPTWIKVNTRIPWHDGMKGEEYYTLIAQEDSLKETIFKKKTYRSELIFGRGNKRYGESRYSLINVPEGTHTYTFYFWNCSSDTILLDFSFASPNIWVDIIPSNYTSTLTLYGNEEKQTYYTLSADTPVEIKALSPINIKVLTRLNFDQSMKGRYGYTIIVKEKEKVVKKVSFIAEKSEVYEYENRSDTVPSKENRFFLWFARGSHTLTFHLQGAAGMKAAISFLKEEKAQ